MPLFHLCSPSLWQAYADYMGFILTLNEGVKGKKLTFEYRVSEVGAWGVESGPFPKQLPEPSAAPGQRTRYPDTCAVDILVSTFLRFLKIFE